MIHLLEPGVYIYYLAFFCKISFFLTVLENIFTLYIGILEMYLVLLIFKTLLWMNIRYLQYFAIRQMLLSTLLYMSPGTHVQVSPGNIPKSGKAGL